MSEPSGMPGYRINEYRLVVPLPEALQDKVQHLRESLYEKHSIKSSFELKPALTLLHCHAFEQIEHRLTERLQHIALGMHPFKVELENFSAYPSHTIYIHVATRSPFNELVKELKKARWLMNIPQHEPHFISEPHLILAQKLKPMKFIGLWMECEHKPFSGRFIADALLLLKRNAVSNRWEEVRRMEFMSLPMAVKQGELFA